MQIGYSALENMQSLKNKMNFSVCTWGEVCEAFVREMKVPLQCCSMNPFSEKKNVCI